MQLTIEEQLKLARINGILEAFAELSSFWDCTYQFSIEFIPRNGDIRTSIAKWATGIAEVREWTELPAWQEELRMEIHRFLFDFMSGHKDVSQAEEYLFQQLITFLAPLSAWKILLIREDTIECGWIDLVFEKKDGLALLHLGGGD